MENQEPIVKDPLIEGQPSEGTEAMPKEGAETTPQAGEKTESVQLLKSLQEEREKRRMAEEEAELLKKENEDLKTSTFSGDYSDEGKALKGEISDLKSELLEVKGELTKKDILITHPVLNDKWAEFEEFRSHPDNKGMNMRTSAKAFMVENGFMEPTRKGLEKPTGGDRTPPQNGMNAEDVKILRTTNFKKYQDLIREGKLKIV